jgi:hypothetical protein
VDGQEAVSETTATTYSAWGHAVMLKDHSLVQVFILSAEAVLGRE